MQKVSLTVFLILKSESDFLLQTSDGGQSGWGRDTIHHLQDTVPSKKVLNLLFQRQKRLNGFKKNVT